MIHALDEDCTAITNLAWEYVLNESLSERSRPQDIRDNMILLLPLMQRDKYACNKAITRQGR